MTIRVLAVDDHRMFADALALLVDAEDGLESAGAVHTAEDAIDRCREDCPDVVLMDVHLPGIDGVEGIRRIRESCPETQFVVISALQEGDVLASAVEAGACGFVPKTQAVDELLDVIRRAAAGEMVLPAGQIEPTLRRLREARHGARNGRGSRERLTPREVEILQGFAHGWSTQEVAARMFLSVHTVNHHMGSILRKLECRSKLEAVLTGLRLGLVELSKDG